MRIKTSVQIFNCIDEGILETETERWVAVDDIIKWMELKVHRAGVPYQIVEELKKSLSNSELPSDVEK